MTIGDEVQAANKRMNRALAGADASAVAALYTEDARLLPAGGPRFDGRVAIEGFFKQASDSGFTDLKLQTQEVLEAGDLAIEVGAWTGGGDVGKYVVVWKRESGDLKLHIDIFNSDNPPTGELMPDSPGPPLLRPSIAVDSGT